MTSTVDPNNKVRPHSSLLKQQRLPSWQPILTPPHVSACLILTTAIFIPLGVAILNANNSVVDVEIRYDNVRSCSINNNDRISNFTINNKTTSMGCLTKVNFQITERMDPPIYMYYKLTNFYQNHRRYAQSRLDVQLAGGTTTSTSDCDPLATVGQASNLQNAAITLNGVNLSYGSFLYSPAGLIAWSMFNDSFTLSKYPTTTPNAYTIPTLICNGSDFSKYTNLPLGYSVNNSCVKRGIAWPSDVADKFKIPMLDSTAWSAPWSGYGTTPMLSSDAYYSHGWYAGEPGHNIPVTTDEDFMVWMRTSSLPDFRKLYRIINVTLDPGLYSMTISEFFDVSGFDGTKSFALTTLSWLGGKNPFLATVYLVLGCVSFVGAVVFAIVHFTCGDRTQRAIDELMHDTH